MSDEMEVQMYVQQVSWEKFVSLIAKVTNVNKVYMYNMPNKAESYCNKVEEMIKTIDGYISGEEKWRETNETNVSFRFNKEQNCINVGNWIITEPKLILCIPKLNSFFIIPSDTSTYKGSPAPTQIIQLSNCMSVMPMLLTMKEVPDETKDGVINIALSYEMF